MGSDNSHLETPSACVNLTFLSEPVAQLCQGAPNITSSLMGDPSLGPDLTYDKILLQSSSSLASTVTVFMVVGSCSQAMFSANRSEPKECGCSHLGEERLGGRD